MTSGTLPSPALALCLLPPACASLGIFTFALSRLPQGDSLGRFSSACTNRPAPPLKGASTLRMTSQALVRMSQEVLRQTPTRPAHLPSVSPATMCPTQSAHALGGSFDRASSPAVVAPNVLPRPARSRRWPCSSLPFLTTWEWWHLGRSAGSPAGTEDICASTAPQRLYQRLLLLQGQRKRPLQHTLAHSGSP